MSPVFISFFFHMLPFLPMVVSYDTVKSAVWASVKFSKSSGCSKIWHPRTPALILTSSNSSTVSSTNVGNFFFIPMGEQPPRIYPVSPNKSLI